MATRRKVLTLAFVTDAGRVLLGYKKRGFGAGKVNGFGGKVEVGETIEEGAARELAEESGVAPAAALQRRGLITFEFKGDDVLMEVHVFTCAGFVGDVVETEEMRPQWYPIAALPLDDMWVDDKLWLPQVLAGGFVVGTALFDGHDVIVSHDIHATDEAGLTVAVAEAAASPVPVVAVHPKK